MKPKRYRVALLSNQGEQDGVPVYSVKWVSEWPVDPREWGARFEASPKASDALELGRDTALYIANTIRTRNGAWAMVEEA